MDTTSRIITIFGATGFVGQYIVRELARAGYRLRIITRDTQHAAPLKTQGEVGQIAIAHGDITDPESYRAELDGAYAVINLVGILAESGRQTFPAIHAQAPEKLAQCASEAGVERMLHMSALGVDKAKTSKYAKTKLMGEKAVKAAFPEATIFRPSVIFGPEDHFYNQFASMSRFSPMLPLIGGGHTKFQPVYVGDVADAFLTALKRSDTSSHIYELGGPEVMSFRQVLDSIRRYTNRKPCLVRIPSAMASLGATFTQLLPRPPLTRDQVELLKYDNVVSDQSKGFAELGIHPKHPDDIVPDYLARFAREKQVA